MLESTCGIRLVIYYMGGRKATLGSMIQVNKGLIKWAVRNFDRVHIYA